MNLDCVIPAVLSRVHRRHKIVYDIRDAWGLCLTGQPLPIPQVFTILDQLFTPYVDGLLLSQGNLEACAEFFGKRARQRTPVIQVLNVPQHDLGKTRRTPGAGPLVINYSGAISALRGGYVLADTVEGRKDVRMHVYGRLNDSNLRQRLESMENVDFEGRVDFHKAIDYIDQDDLVSLLYDPALKVIFISSANKMFEAMMMGKPYICTLHSYPAQVAERFGLGWPLPYGDTKALAALLDKLVKSPELLARAGDNGRAAYEKCFRWEKQRANLVALYRRLAGDESVVVGKHAGWYRFVGDAAS
jgi:glycosyltransferase involved in cell wall biosynthesis